MTPLESSVPRFIGSSGDDWCCRAAMLGPPDKVNDYLLHWLLFPGPPIASYLAYHVPIEDVSTVQFFHQHPQTSSVHTVISGAGECAIADRRHELMPGSVVYVGPGVPHSFYPLPKQHLAYVVVQHPTLGYAPDQWQVSPTSGTVNRPGDLDAFVTAFGPPDQLARRVHRQLYVSERWRHFVDRHPPRQER